MTDKQKAWITVGGLAVGAILVYLYYQGTSPLATGIKSGRTPPYPGTTGKGKTPISRRTGSTSGLKGPVSPKGRSGVTVTGVTASNPGKVSNPPPAKNPVYNPIATIGGGAMGNKPGIIGGIIGGIINGVTKVTNPSAPYYPPGQIYQPKPVQITTGSGSSGGGSSGGRQGAQNPSPNGGPGNPGNPGQTPSSTNMCSGLDSCLSTGSQTSTPQSNPESNPMTSSMAQIQSIISHAVNQSHPENSEASGNGAPTSSVNPGQALNSAATMAKSGTPASEIPSNNNDTSEYPNSHVASAINSALSQTQSTQPPTSQTAESTAANQVASQVASQTQSFQSVGAGSYGGGPTSGGFDDWGS